MLTSWTLVLILVFALITHSAISSLAFGLLSGIFISAGFSDIRSGVIPNSAMSMATLVAIALNVLTGNPVGALVRISVVVLVWGIFATARFARKGIGGGDLKMIGVTWLALAAFPIPLALVLLMAWALIFSVVLAMMRLHNVRLHNVRLHNVRLHNVRLHNVRRLRAGLALAAAAILTWMIGLGILA